MVKKKLLAVMALVLAFVFIFASCGKEKTETTSTASKETYTVVDQLGRRVTVPKDVKRIVCLQHHTLDIMLELQAGDKLVGVVKDWQSLLGDYVKDVYKPIEKLPTPGGLDDINIESVVALKPDVVFFAHQLPKEFIEKLDQAGIPSIGISMYEADKEQASTISPKLVNPDAAYNAGMEKAVTLIGQVVGKEDKAKELLDYIKTNRSLVSKDLESIPDDKKIKVYMANPDMYTYGTGKYVGVAMEKAGAKNVAEELKGYKQAKMEDIVKWNPSVIFVQSRYESVLNEIKNNPAWKEIDAVKNNKLIVAPDYVKPWGSPCPESMALGELWLAKTLYPDKFKDIDLDKLVQDFYKKFYGIDYKA